jgi:GTPase SAR1 family protein
LAPIYYRDAKGAILVYDVSVADTFKRVQKWVAELKNFNKNTIIAIAGNKIDLKIHFESEKQEVTKYLEEHKIKLFYTSAKTGEGLDEIFEYISNEICESIINKLNSGRSNPKTGTKKLQVKKDDTNLNSQKEGGCCK